MKKLIAVLLLLCSCTIQIPDNIRARSIIRSYLDSVNRPNKVEVIKFSELIRPGFENLKPQNYADSTYETKSESEKVVFKKMLDSLQGSMKSYDMFCKYKVNNVVHVNLFKIDTTLRKVRGTAEIDHLSLF